MRPAGCLCETLDNTAFSFLLSHAQEEVEREEARGEAQEERGEAPSQAASQAQKTSTQHWDEEDEEENGGGFRVLISQGGGGARDERSAMATEASSTGKAARHLCGTWAVVTLALPVLAGSPGEAVDHSALSFLTPQVADLSGGTALKKQEKRERRRRRPRIRQG